MADPRGDPAAREVLDVATRWATERLEMKALIGAVVDAANGTTSDGLVMAFLAPELVAELRRHAGT